MILMILILATLFYVMLIISFFALTLLEKEKEKFSWFTIVLCLFGFLVSYLFLNNFYDNTYFTQAQIMARYDYKFIHFMQYVYCIMCIIMDLVYIIKRLFFNENKLKG